MRKIIIGLFIILLGWTTTQAQDIESPDLIFRKGQKSSLKVKIDGKPNEKSKLIFYKSFDKPESENQEISTSQIDYVKLGNGKVVDFNPSPKYSALIYVAGSFALEGFGQKAAGGSYADNGFGIGHEGYFNIIKGRSPIRLAYHLSFSNNAQDVISLSQRKSTESGSWKNIRIMPGLQLINPITPTISLYGVGFVGVNLSSVSVGSQSISTTGLGYGAGFGVVYDKHINVLVRYLAGKTNINATILDFAKYGEQATDTFQVGIGYQF